MDLIEAAVVDPIGDGDFSPSELVPLVGGALLEVPDDAVETVVTASEETVETDCSRSEENRGESEDLTNGENLSEEGLACDLLLSREYRMSPFSGRALGRFSTEATEDAAETAVEDSRDEFWLDSADDEDFAGVGADGVGDGVMWWRTSFSPC